MDDLGSVIANGSSVMEFGSGMGGNLLAISSKISKGIGIDINPWYVKHARRLAERSSSSNIVFVKYDGEVIPFPASSFDVVLSIGVFERLPRNRVASYVGQIARSLRAGGLAILYFLSPRARLTTFVDRLGEDAYVFWSAKDATQLVEQAGLRIYRSRGWGNCPRRDGAGSEYVADVYYATKPSRPSENLIEEDARGNPRLLTEAS